MRSPTCAAPPRVSRRERAANAGSTAMASAEAAAEARTGAMAGARAQGKGDRAQRAGRVQPRRNAFQRDKGQDTASVVASKAVLLVLSSQAKHRQRSAFRESKGRGTASFVASKAVLLDLSSRAKHRQRSAFPESKGQGTASFVARDGLFLRIPSGRQPARNTPSCRRIATAAARVPAEAGTGHRPREQAAILPPGLAAGTAAATGARKMAARRRLQQRPGHRVLMPDRRVVARARVARGSHREARAAEAARPAGVAHLMLALRGRAGIRAKTRADRRPARIEGLGILPAALAGISTPTAEGAAGARPWDR